MSPNTNPSRVLFIGDPGPVQQQISTALGANTDFLLVDVLGPSERLFREIHAAEPDIILVDHILGGQPTIDIIDDISLQFSDAAVIAVLVENDPVLIQQALMAGARAFIVQPFTQLNLLSTLQRVQELETRRKKSEIVASASKSAEQRTLNSLAVFGPRGGSGTSTVAINLAMSLYESTGANILLIDGKLFFGHLDVLLNIRARNTIIDLIPHANSMDEALVREIVIRHALGIHVLLAPSDLQVAQGIRPDDLYNVFVGLKRFYDFIVIDAGSMLTENTVTLLDSVDRILLVTAPDLASLHDISRFIQISKSLGYPSEKMLLVLNRASELGGVKAKDIEASLRHQLYAQIPDDGANALRSINRGIPLTVKYPRSPAAKAIKQIAGRLIAMSLADGSKPQPAGTTKAQQEALIASSQLG